MTGTSELAAQPIEVFYSYAHKDEVLREELETHLSVLQWQGRISGWRDRNINAGSPWAQEIDTHLNTAQIILLLISADFLASDYCYSIEMQRALERHTRKEARVIPIILKPCDWRHAPFADLLCLPHDGKPVTTWSNQDEAFASITQELRRVIERQAPPVRPSRPLSSAARQNRLRLLKRVRQMWITGVLEHSLHQGALIALGLQEQPDALANPWHLEIQETNLPPRPLPAETSIVQVYDEAGGELLILGEPGAGKTTLLLELTRALLERAEAEEHHRLPVVFNLSSWAHSRQPLATWLVEELWTKYQVPRKLGQAWMDTDQILPLLDGLDEVAKNARFACVKAINAYSHHRLEGGAPPLLVCCCRNQEYHALPTRVKLRQAVSIQPLTKEQIDTYLGHAGEQVAAVRAALHDDAVLQKLATTPMMLNILTLAYQGSSLEDLASGETPEARRRHVLEVYVKRMLEHRSAEKRYTAQQTIHWLACLAKQLVQHDQTIFYLESIQPDWLTKHGSQRAYKGLASFVVGLLNGLVVGWVFGPLWGLVIGLLAGLALGTGSRLQEVKVTLLSWPSMWRDLGIGQLLGVFSGLVFAKGFQNGSVSAPLSMFGVLVGLALGPTWGVSIGRLVGNPFLQRWLSGGLSMQTLDEYKRLKPNEGIWRSARQNLLYGLASGPLVGLLAAQFLSPWIVGSSGVLIVELSFSSLLRGLLIGEGFGLLFFSLLFTGGLACIQHGILRVLLWHAGETSQPWRYVHFLDYADKRIVLRKVGGGYIFIHRLLLDYFADVETPSSEEASASQREPIPSSGGVSRRPASLLRRGVPVRVPTSRRRRHYRRRQP